MDRAEAVEKKMRMDLRFDPLDFRFPGDGAQSQHFLTSSRLAACPDQHRCAREDGNKELNLPEVDQARTLHKGAVSGRRAQDRDRDDRKVGQRRRRESVR